MVKISVIAITLAVLMAGHSSVAAADGGPGFRCSVCGSSGHGSLWHDSDKDGTPDR